MAWGRNVLVFDKIGADAMGLHRTRARAKSEPIDFVVTWVDGSDPEWLEEKRRYVGDGGNGMDASARRYRDWGLLRYVFRSIDAFAPWVRQVFLITCGHLPSWINTQAKGLVLVKHSDYIPEEYLPTFSSRPIELNLHRLPELSENFVNVNDDMFLTRSVRPELFFRHGIPVMSPCLHAIVPWGHTGVMAHTYVNNVSAVNRHFDFHSSLRQNAVKWFNPAKVGVRAFLENAHASLYQQFLGFRAIHVPQPLKKSTIEEIWEKEEDLLRTTCSHRARSASDASVYILWNWQLASGEFIPCRPNKLGRVYDIKSDTLSDLTQAIRRQRHPMLCANDMGHITDVAEFELAKATIREAFDSILPNRCRFEL